MAVVKGSLLFPFCCFVLLLNNGCVSPDSGNKSRPGGIVYRPGQFKEVSSQLQVISQQSNTISEILALQQAEFVANPDYEEAWNTAESRFYDSTWDRIFSNTLSNSIVNCWIPNQLHIALIAYTLMRPPVYTDFNAATRVCCFRMGACTDCYPWSSLFQLLHIAMEIFGNDIGQFFDTYEGTNVQLFRGDSVAYNLVIGDHFGFPQFTSTSLSRDVAMNYTERTLFEFRGLNRHTLAMPMWDHSASSRQDEVLLSPSNLFRLDNVRFQDNYTILSVVYTGQLQNAVGNYTILQLR